MGQREELIDLYVNGQYDWIVIRCDALHAGRSEWESHYVTCDAYAALALADDGFHDEYNDAVEDLYRECACARSAPANLVRTEIDWTGRHTTELARLKYGSKPSPRLGRVPEVGTTLHFVIKSASKDPEFAERVARDDIAGIGRLAGGETVVETGSEVLAYRIQGATRYLDIEEMSDWPGQREVLIAGAYRVVATEIVTYMAPHLVDEVITWREYAEREGLALEWFTSKRGERCVRFGTRVMPEKHFDDEGRYRTGNLVNDPKPITIRYVDLVEVDEG